LFTIGFFSDARSHCHGPGGKSVKKSVSLLLVV
jgi:hypothetical protein